MKRVILFLLLLGLGFAALRWAIGDDVVVTANGPGSSGETPADRGRTGVGMPQGGAGTSIEQRGAFEYPKTRAIPLPGGGTRHERIFVLKAKDSQPLRDGLQQLDGVEITLYDKDEPTAVITSRQAFVELGRDGNGKPSLREDKAIDLRDVVLRTLPGARLEGLRLELGNAKVLVGESDLQIVTATENDPVLLEIAGKDHGTLRGKGLQARLPRDRHSALQRADIDILHEPVLETEGLVVRGAGRLHYTEDLSTGTAQMNVADVEIEIDGGNGGLRFPGSGAAVPASRGTTRLRGDQLAGWLLRGKQRGEDGEQHERLVWRLLQLSGAPVMVEAPGLRFETPRLTVVPGPFGEPSLITASGGLSRVEVAVEPKVGEAASPPRVGTSQRRIHLLRPAAQAGAIHRLFGFPEWTLRPITDLNAVAFEGRSNLADDTSTIDASQGLHLFSTDPTQEGAIAKGFGEVVIHQRAGKPRDRELHATGSDGFLMLSSPTFKRLDLGPLLPMDLEAGDDRWRSHRYTLQHGQVTARGTGACRLVQQGDRTAISLRAPGAEIEAALPGEGARLSAVRSLVTEFDDREVSALRVTGLPATATFRRNGETLVATAPLLERIGPASLCLLQNQPGNDAPLWHELAADQALPHLQRRLPASPLHGAELVDVRAPRIELHHLGADHVLVDAMAAGEQPARVDATLEHVDGSKPTKVELEAARLRLFPFAISPAAMVAHSAGATGLVAELPFFALRQPWLLGERVRRVVVGDPQAGIVEGRGHRLLLSAGAESGLFVGDPDTMTPAVVTNTQQGRVVTASGACVRVSRDGGQPTAETKGEDKGHGGGLHLQALRTFPGRPLFLLPSVELHQPDSDNSLAHLRATCRGDIDVLPDRVVFQGPVVANSLDANGSETADGMHIDAEQLLMERHRETREITRVIGKAVGAEWRGMRARSAEMEIDLKWNLCTVRDPAGATVDFPDGRRLTAERATVNYDTLSFDWYRGRLQQTIKPKANPW